jgi:KipI family sensor histidine kinase inhibitor
VKVLRYGERALLAEAGAEWSVPALAAAAAGLAGACEVVPGARTVLIRFDSPPQPEQVRAMLSAAAADPPPGPASPATTELIEIPVHYDGPDLDAVAELTGLTRQEVIARHAAADYTVAFCGFAPGFAYLTGLDSALEVPRLAHPRRSVPAGAVAIAGPYAAVYPRPSPGGWRLIGHTETQVWDVRHTPPALLAPGRAVRFVPA